MTQRGMFVGAAAAAMLALSAGCNKSAPPPPPSAPGSGSASVAPGSGSGASKLGGTVEVPAGSGSGSGSAGSGSAAVAPTGTVAELPPADPGPAIIGVDSVGLFRLDGGKVTKVMDYKWLFYDAVVAPSGDVYVAGIDGLYQVTGGKATRVPGESNPNFEHLAIGADGVVWAAGSAGVSSWDGKAWKVEPRTTFGDELLSAIAIDDKGDVWTATSKNLWRRSGGAWGKVDTGGGLSGDPFFQALARGPGGAMYVAAIGGISSTTGSGWTTLPKPDGSYASYDELLIGRDGTVVATGGVDDLLITRPGATPQGFDVPKLGLTARRFDVLAVDGSGRIWLSSDNGVAVVSADGKLLQQWLPGTVEGITGKVSVIAVTGGGPQLPTPGAQVMGNIVGKVIRGGEALAGVKVELCESPFTMFQTSPCDSGTLVRTATTDAGGQFRLTDVPAGKFGFALQPKGEKWLILMGGDCCSGIKAGKDYDVGSINLDE